RSAAAKTATRQERPCDELLLRMAPQNAEASEGAAVAASFGPHGDGAGGSAWTGTALEPAMKPIPFTAARRVAKAYGYDQIIIIVRKIGDDGGEHVTTYGRDVPNCVVAASIGDFFKAKLMGWKTIPPKA